MTEDILDLVIVGGGPVGLHAALKAGLLGLSAVVVDKGQKWSRGFFVPKFHNFPSYPDGISGAELHRKQKKALEKHKEFVRVEDFVIIESIQPDGKIFTLKGYHQPTKAERLYRSRVVVLSTGVVDRQPLIKGELKTILPYANKGLVHYCIFCDGFLAKGNDVAILGHGMKAALTANDLTYFKAKKLTILTDGKKLFESNEVDSKKTEELHHQLSSRGVTILEDRIEGLFGLKDNKFGVRLSSGQEMLFDRAFSALGLYKIINDLAIQLGGKVDNEGYIVVDEDCRVLDGKEKPISGLYAVGDINNNWNQIMIGIGDAERAVIHAFAEYL